ncbi:hypothetical protein [Marinobacter confluentis]|uniref:Uncharacterized protein n=1 Tax=Marinobacter confluentis TaxID=1697557 RepID=A0A4Z1BMX1_9GAMM|nr:hypothetical protein [Marinobacter confluentis]TGN41337.1 hypothetical protein E5Q11_01955 [Marinobacter confluentis]
MLRTGYEPLIIGLTLVLTLAGCGRNDDLGQMEVELAPAELTWIGDQIFQNECAGRESCLVHWNEGEAFPSLGIGHFIWYPAGIEGPFVESFPVMIAYLSEQGVELPDWLSGLEPFDAPWENREIFLAQSGADRVRELRAFLSSTRGEQAGFVVQRAKQALRRVVLAAPAEQRESMSERIESLIQTPGGTYALIDYVNFKGEGLAEAERYKGQGWGLLQVLQGMLEHQGTPALTAFRKSAAAVLTRRADNAEQPIEKARWLPGWLNRLETYREPE